MASQMSVVVSHGDILPLLWHTTIPACFPDGKTLGSVSHEPISLHLHSLCPVGGLGRVVQHQWNFLPSK